MSKAPVWQLPGTGKARAPKKLRSAADAASGTGEKIRRTVTFLRKGVVHPGKNAFFPCAVGTGIFD